VPRIAPRLAVPQKTDCSDPKIPISEVLLENPHYELGERGSIEVRSGLAKYDRKAIDGSEPQKPVLRLNEWRTFLSDRLPLRPRSFYAQ
jgi:hypothetical protein